MNAVNLDSIQRAYRRYAQFYDISFGAIFEPGRAAVIESMGLQPGDSVLEVGVGTGLSLSLYPKSVHVTGIDISRDMLERARLRKMRQRLANVTLKLMDAENMSFPDNSFDAVVAMYVASVVPDPCRLVDEMRRVCRPDGELYVVNHFQNEHPLICGVERMLSPLSRLLGFRPDFCLEDFISKTRIDVVQRTSVNLCGYWTLLRARNNKEDMHAGTCSLGACTSHPGDVMTADLSA